MRLIIVASVAFCLADAGGVQGYMEHAFYPVLLGLLIIASLGVPIPEDIPLLAAGVLLRTHPGIATWPGTFLVALAGIMTGDLILYHLGRLWGPDVVNHRFVRRLITPPLLRKATEKFHRYGSWYCFFGRFFMGVRAVMCMTAGATRFPRWRFLLADCAGALLSMPLFIYLGYWFAGMIPTLRAYLTGVQGILTAGAALVIAAIAYYEYRKIRRRRRALTAAQSARAESTAHSLPTGASPLAAPAPKPSQSPPPASLSERSLPTEEVQRCTANAPTAGWPPAASDMSVRVPPEPPAHPPAGA